MKETKYMKYASLEAEKSLFYNKHGTVIVSHGKIVARGHNNIRSMRYHRESSSCHSEMDALSKLSDRFRKLPISVYNARINKHGHLKESAPCKHCMEYMSSFFNVRYISFINKDGDIVKENMRNFTTNHVTHGNRLSRSLK
mgnify:CR=1 FL=1